MRIAVVSPHLPSRALPMRGVSHDEQLRWFAAAGHDVRGVVPLRWSPRRWLTGTAIPDERDGTVVVAHPRYPRLPRLPGLERRLFARAALAALGTGPAAPEVILTHSVSLPGGLLGKIGRAVFVVALHDHELYDLAPHDPALRRAIVQTLLGAHCAVYVSEALRRQAPERADKRG